VRAITFFALSGIAALLIAACEDTGGKSSEGSAGGDFRLSLSKRELPLDVNMTP
jgi:hypothetical protein